MLLYDLEREEQITADESRCFTNTSAACVVLIRPPPLVLCDLMVNLEYGKVK
jgi:hypothetical protein